MFTETVNQPKKPRASIGRDPRDNRGTEAPIDAVMGRIWEITCFFFCCGCIFNLLDHLYSSITHQDRVIGEGRKPKPGVDHLDSIWLNSCLKSPTDYEGFLRTYYNYDRALWIPTSPEYSDLVQTLRDQMYKDIASRRYRKDRGTNIITWTATLLGAAVAVIEFARKIVATSHNGDSKKNQDALNTVSTIEGILGLLALIVTQLTNKSIQKHSDAVSSLDDLYDWTDTYFKEKKCNAEKNSLHKFFPGFSISDSLSPIRAKLIEMEYTFSSSRNLYEAISSIRKSAGFEDDTAKKVKLSIDNYQKCKQAVNVERKANISSISESPSLHMGNEILEDIYDLSKIYECPIFLISEANLVGVPTCLIFNEKSSQAESKQSEELRMNNLKIPGVGELRYMLLYRSESELFHPMYSSSSSATLVSIKEQLMGLSVDGAMKTNGSFTMEPLY